MENVLRQKRMALAGLGLNVVILAAVSLIAILCDDGTNKFWKMGPSQDLKIISLSIDSSSRYACLVLFIVLLNAARVIVDDVCNPTIFFPCYDPNVNEVVGW